MEVTEDIPIFRDDVEDLEGKNDDSWRDMQGIESLDMVNFEAPFQSDASFNPFLDETPMNLNADPMTYTNPY